jgi:biopolymer transport protein ExbD
MGAVDVPQTRSSGKKAKGGRRAKRRVGIRIDMTPMVDVAFLLLIFFMVTTVFRTPQALEINLPPNDEKTQPVAQSKVLEIRVLPDRAFWRNAADPWSRSDVSALTTVFDKFRGDNNKIVIVRVDREAKFNYMVHIIDELDLAKLTRFSLQTLSPAERKEVETL